MALGAVALIAVGFGVWWSDSQDPGPARARIGERPDARRAGSGSGGADLQGARRELPVDAGVLAQIPRRAEGAVPAGSPGRGTGRTPEELPGNATDTEHTSGWRLGQSRRRIVILQSRLARLHAQLELLEQQGRTDVAARQRAVLDRFEARLGEMRAEEQELLPLAERDGTMGEVDRGYEEGETESERPTSPAITPTPVLAP